MEELEPTYDFSSIKPEWQKAQVRMDASEQLLSTRPKRMETLSQISLSPQEAWSASRRLGANWVLLMDDMRFPKAWHTASSPTAIEITLGRDLEPTHLQGFGSHTARLVASFLHVTDSEDISFSAQACLQISCGAKNHHPAPIAYSASPQDIIPVAKKAKWVISILLPYLHI